MNLTAKKAIFFKVTNCHLKKLEVCLVGSIINPNFAKRILVMNIKAYEI